MPDVCEDTGTASLQDSGAWRKSSRSMTNGNCVEVAELSDGAVGVRDSKDPQGGVLRFTPEEWKRFLGGVGRQTPAPRD